MQAGPTVTPKDQIAKSASKGEIFVGLARLCGVRGLVSTRHLTMEIIIVSYWNSFQRGRKRAELQASSAVAHGSRDCLKSADL